MIQCQYRVTVIAHLDGLFTTTDSEIRGLVLETDSFKEMRDELLRVGARLLRSNHNLTDDEIENAIINIKVRVDQGEDPEPTRCPRLLYEDAIDVRLVA